MRQRRRQRPRPAHRPTARSLVTAAAAWQRYYSIVFALGAVAAQLLAHTRPARGRPDSVQLLPDNGGAGRKVTLELQLNTTDEGVVEVMTFEQDGAPAMRFLRSGRSIIGAEFVSEEYRGQSAFRNFAILQTVGFKAGRGRGGEQLRVLQLGLGAGTVPSYLRREHGALVDVVEISPDIVEAATRHFHYNRDPSPVFGTTHTEDALAFLRRKPGSRRYDVVIHDLFTGGHHPLRLLERSVLHSIKARWLAKDGGVLVVDFFGYQHAGPAPRARNVNSVAVQATLEAVFGPPPFVRCFRELDVNLFPDKPANLIFVAWVSGPPAAGAPPFVVPLDPSSGTTDGDGSVYQVQRHFHEFEVTPQLRPRPGSALKGFPEDMAIGPARAATAHVDERFVEDYRDMLASFFPPAVDWFPERQGGTTAYAEEL